MDNNIRILVVNNEGLKSTLTALGLHNVTMVNTAAEAIKEFVNEHKNKSYNLTFIGDLERNEDLELLHGIMEIDSTHYVVMLPETISAEKIVNSIRAGASGILNQPFTAHKIQMEIEKYKFLKEDKKVAGL